jgi:hypothetical protein
VIEFCFQFFMSLYAAWEPNKQYVYKVQGRALTALHQIADQYTGILVKGELAIEPRTHQELRGKVGTGNVWSDDTVRPTHGKPRKMCVYKKNKSTIHLHDHTCN